MTTPVPLASSWHSSYASMEMPEFAVAGSQQRVQNQRFDHELSGAAGMEQPEQRVIWSSTTANSTITASRRGLPQRFGGANETGTSGGTTMDTTETMVGGGGAGMRPGEGHPPPGLVPAVDDDDNDNGTTMANHHWIHNNSNSTASEAGVSCAASCAFLILVITSTHVQASVCCVCRV